MAQSTRPVLGYLTTSWSPPATCLSLMVFGTSSMFDIGYQGVTCVDKDTVYDETDCWPPRTANAPNPTEHAALSGWGFYSPGILCPSGFTTACVATYGQVVSDWQLQFQLTTGETAAGCCPSGGYTCHYSQVGVVGSNTYGAAQTCRLLATSTTIEVAPCTTDSIDSRPISAVLPYTATITRASVRSTTTHDSLEALAPLIQINWRAEDLTTSIPTQISSSAPTPTSTDSGGDGGGNISGGVIAGIVVGAFFGLAAIAIGIFWFMRKNRTKRTDVNDQSRDPDCAPDQQHSQPVKPQQEMQQPFELPMTGSAIELPGHEVADVRLHPELQG